MVNMNDVTLIPITEANRDEVLALEVHPAQQEYVADVAESLDDADRYPQAMPWYRAAYADGRPSGS